MKIFSSLLFSFLLVVLLGIPFISHVALAVDPVPGSTIIIPCEGVNASNQSDCNFAKLVELGENLIKYMVYLSIPLAAVAFAVAGFKYMLAGGNPGKIKEAHQLFEKVAIGFFFVLAAWLIVNLITTALLKPEFYTNILR